mmetsp:Transcript_45839/g.90957  ORF Transcript_45839/g.90957 Transcript_45839/m.90957 type:complete len:245 (-) Transcript_45839:2142-2876(-)
MWLVSHAPPHLEICSKLPLGPRALLNRTESGRSLEPQRARAESGSGAPRSTGRSLRTFRGGVCGLGIWGGGDRAIGNFLLEDHRGPSSNTRMLGESALDRSTVATLSGDCGPSPQMLIKLGEGGGDWGADARSSSAPEFPLNPLKDSGDCSSSFSHSTSLSMWLLHSMGARSLGVIGGESSSSSSSSRSNCSASTETFSSSGNSKTASMAWAIAPAHMFPTNAVLLMLSPEINPPVLASIFSFE